MENYKELSKVGQEMILTYLKNRMKEHKITQEEVADTLEVGRTTVIRWFKMETPMPLGSYLEICGLLKLRPYLIPAKDDNTEMKRVFFN
jgi:transcriptional regulator with XRE-family HTH domain